jgi:hypothetical protein
VVRAIYIYVPGILTLPGGKNWCGKAVTWTHLHTEFRAEKVEYLTTPLTRPFREAERAQKSADTMCYYKEWDINLAGHSNGCDMILDSLKNQGWPKLKSLNMISGACECDFEKSGLNKLEVEKPIVVWIGKEDWALQLAGTFCGKLLGYGTLGRDGAVNATVPVNYIRRNCGHTQWFDDDQFDHTMETII